MVPKWLTRYFANYVINKWSNAFGPISNPSVFEVLYLVKYFGGFQYFISRDIKNRFKNAVTLLLGESAAVSCKIVLGMIDGLRYLHGQGIIHRDVCLSNLILKRERNDVNVVIIDYETAFDSGGNHSTGNEVDYSGGYICWLRRLLQSKEQSYMPEPADDLFTCILVVLHLLFPCRFDEFNAGNIRPDDNQNPETSRLLQMWRDIESSKIWGQFYQAASNHDYDGLLEISEVFCHV